MNDVGKGGYDMNTHDIQQERIKNNSSVGRKHFTKKIWLIAAIIISGLLLVGCAMVSIFRLQDMKVIEHTHSRITFEAENNHDVTEWQTMLVSVQENKESPNQLAMREWLAYTDTYDVDGAILRDNSQNNSEIPEKYLIYGCYTWDMVTKLEEIIRQYNLKLLTKQEIVQSYDKPSLMERLNISGIVHDLPTVEVIYQAGYYYAEGSFMTGSMIQLTDDNALWTYPIMLEYRYSAKDYFDPAYLSIKDPSTYNQWNYLTCYGNEVLLALGDEAAIIICDRDDAYITVLISSTHKDRCMTSLVLEQIADILDFSIRPDPTIVDTNMSATETIPLDSDSIKEYVEVVSRYLEVELYPSEPTYALIDINGDSTNELLIKSASDDGIPYLDIFSIMDGNIYMVNAIPVNYFCKGNIFESYVKTERKEIFTYYKMDGNGLTITDSLILDRSVNQWSRDKDGSFGNPATAISWETAIYLINSYVRADIDMTPISEYPFE